MTMDNCVLVVAVVERRRLLPLGQAVTRPMIPRPGTKDDKDKDDAPWLGRDTMPWWLVVGKEKAATHHVTCVVVPLLAV